MSKVNIKISLINKETNYKTEGKAILKEDKEVIYQEDSGIIIKYNIEKNILERETPDMKLTYQFQEKGTTKGTVFIKNLNKSFDINIKTNKIIHNKNRIEVYYEIDKEKNHLIIDLK